MQHACSICSSLQVWFNLAGEYKQNLCSSSDMNCKPCPIRLPSCLGLNNGNYPHPSHLWGQDYIMCFHNRTIEVLNCRDGYFNPRTRRCTSFVDPGLYQFQISNTNQMHFQLKSTQHIPSKTNIYTTGDFDFCVCSWCDLLLPCLPNSYHCTAMELRPVL